jgi:hypothetical protein
VQPLNPPKHKILIEIPPYYIDTLVKTISSNYAWHVVSRKNVYVDKKWENDTRTVLRSWPVIFLIIEPQQANFCSHFVSKCFFLQLLTITIVVIGQSCHHLSYKIVTEGGAKTTKKSDSTMLMHLHEKDTCQQRKYFIYQRSKE